LFFSNESIAKKPSLTELKVNKSDHALYILSIGYTEGTFVTEKAKNVVLKVYKSPRNGSQVLFNVPVFDSEREHPGEIISLFDNGKSFPRPESIFSTEKKGDFFKVTYEGKDGWVNKNQFYGITNIEFWVTNGDISIFNDYGKIKLHKNPNSKQVIREDVSSLNRHGTRAKILGIKWVGNKLWLNVEIWNDGASGKKYFKKPLRGWIYPFDKNGKPKFTGAGC
jgi:hypothetical protein